jgi:DNA-binding NarL/FixJ family response regulator
MNTSPEYKQVLGNSTNKIVTFKDLGLTSRQGNILSLVLEGMSNKEIARAFRISESTVKEHMSGILGRMGVSKRVEIFYFLNVRKWTFESRLTHREVPLRAPNSVPNA